MVLSRRRFLTATAAGGALLVAQPVGVLANALGPASSPGTSRASRLFPGTWLVHTDLHNHSLFSDGAGDPELAFESMRSHGLDVAALTDHSVLGGPLGVGLTPCGAACTAVRGIDDASWAATAELADAANQPGVFTAIRGFEWTSPTLGHMNVWLSRDWIDPERTAGLVGVEGIPGYLDELGEELPPSAVGPGASEPLESLVNHAVPATGTMAPFYDWLLAEPGSGLLGGGADAIAGFNHPGREPGRFSYFAFDARLVERIVSIELFNRREDYLFRGTDAGRPSVLTQCLDQGWRVGLLGVTDEHGTDWGAPQGKGRGGLWVTELTRQGVRQAMLARRFFATRELGMRLDAALGGVRMGGTIGHRNGVLPLVIDIAGPGWEGRSLLLQVLRPGLPLPAVALEATVRVPSDDEALPVVEVPLDVADGLWLVVRIVDTDAPADERATGVLAAGRTLAYTSPWWLDPDRAPGGAHAGHAGSAAGRAGSSPPLGPASLPATGVAVGGAVRSPLPAPAPLPATGGLDGARAVASGLALGAALAAGAAARALGDAGSRRHDASGREGLR